jgi:TonB family protein
MLKLTRHFHVTIAAVFVTIASHALALDADVTVTPQMRQFMLSMPRPAYPEQARVQRITGRGMCDIFIDTSNGRATRVAVVQSTRSPILDAAAAKAFLRWRTRPGKIARMRVPFTFTFVR